MESSHEFNYEIVNSRMKPIADVLVAKYEELRHIEVGKILFVVNHKSAGSKKRVVLARTSRVSEKWLDILFQLGSYSCYYMIEYFDKTTACLDENQIVALTYRELRMISPEGNILTPDTNDWWQIIAGLGRHWFYPDSTCPNLLADSTNWKKLMGDQYEPPRAED